MTLFGMFFGAGNLIFPVHLGQLAGNNYLMATIGFIIKGDNCIGLQVADIIPARFMRIINQQSDNYLLNKTFHEKMYCFDTPKEKILGLKNLL